MNHKNLAYLAAARLLWSLILGACLTLGLVLALALRPTTWVRAVSPDFVGSGSIVTPVIPKRDVVVTMQAVPARAVIPAPDQPRQQSWQRPSVVNRDAGDPSELPVPCASACGGDTILVAAGRYTDSLIVNRSSTLRGGSAVRGTAWLPPGIAMSLSTEAIMDVSESQTEEGDWDGRGIHMSIVISDDGMYKMWYAGFGLTGQAIGLATSPDGITWTKYAGNPVLTATLDWEGDNLGHPHVIKDGAVYKMWYGPHDQNIGYAWSSDGIDWTKYTGNPILEGTPGSWDEKGVGAPFVLKIGPNDYQMWYQNVELNRIGHATSTDGITWTKYVSPVLLPGPSGVWDDEAVADPNLLFDGTAYHMWYAGNDGDVWRIGYASSSDGIDWYKSASNPLLSPGAPGEWDDSAVAEPNVLLDGELYRMWFSGWKYGEWMPRRGYATSTDGITWTKYPDNPVLSWLPAPEVGVWKGNISGHARPGGVVVYALEYWNDGTGVATDTLIVDTLPLSTTYAGDTSGVVPEIGTDGVITWNVGHLEPFGDWGAFALTLNVSDTVPTGEGSLPENCAAISTTPPGDYDSGNDTSCAGPVDVWEDDVGVNVDKWPNSNDPAPGQEFEYTIRWCTDRGASFGPVWLTDTLPLSTTVLDWRINEWPRTLWTEVITTGGQFVLYAPGLPGDYCQELYLRLLLDPDVPLGTVLQNTAVVTTPGDVDPGNNARFNTDARVSPPRHDMWVDKNINSSVLVPGGWIDYHIGYWNQGNSAVHAWVTDTLPAGTAYQPGSAREEGGGPPFPPALVTEDYVVWDLGVIGVNEGSGLDFTLDVSDTVTADTVITNCATVGITATGDLTWNNTDCATEMINDHGPNLRVRKDSWWNGDGQLGYHIEFYNVGDESVNDAWITDTLPVSTTWDGWWNLDFDGSRLISQSLGSNVLMWEFSELYPGDSGSIEFNANLDDPSARPRWYTNTVQITTPLSDTVPDDNVHTTVDVKGEVQQAEMWVGTDRSDMWGQAAPNSAVTVTTAYTQVTTTADDGGNWNIGNVGRIYPGDVVTVEAGAGLLPIVIPVPDPFSAYASSITDTVWGQIGGAANEALQVHGYWSGGYKEVPTDGAGNYAAPYQDVPRGGEGHVRYQTEIDYAQAVIHRRFRTPDLAMWVNYHGDHVVGPYELGHTVWFTATDGDGVVKATAVVSTVPDFGWGSTPGFSVQEGDWSPGLPDIVPGDWIYGLVDNGNAAHVRVGTITGTVDVDGDSITGRIYAPWFTQTLSVDCHPWGAPGGAPSKQSSAGPNGDPPYYCQWTEWDVLPGQEIGVFYNSDGSWVGNGFLEPAPYLTVNKWADGNPGQSGNFVFHIDYWNDGDYAEDVLIADTLLGGMAYLTDTSGLAHTGSGVPGDPLVWNLGAVPERWGGGFDLFVEITASAGEAVTNTVEITTSSPYNQSSPEERYSEWSGTVQANDTHLGVGKYIQGSDPAPDTEFTWAVNVCNWGSTASSDLTLTDTLPISTTLLGWWGQNPGWAEVLSTDDQLVLSYPSIPDGWCGEVYLRFHLDENAWVNMPISNTVEISAANDLEGGSAVTDPRWVRGPYANLYVRKDWLQGQLVPGGQLIYEVQYGNDGNAPADDILLTYTLPASTTFDSAWWGDQHGQHLFAPTTVTDGYVVWDLGTLENGFSRNFAVSLHVDGGASPGAVLTSTFEITPHPSDFHTDDNAITWVEVLNDEGPNLEVHKQNYWWNGNNQIGYEVRIKNRCTERLEPVWVTDTYPISTTWNGDWNVGHGPWITVTHDGSNRQIKFWLEALDPGETASIGFRVDLDGAIHGVQGLFFTNTLDAPVPGDVYPADNTDEVVAYAGTDVYAEKWLRSGEPHPGEVVTFTVKFGNRNRWPGIDDVWGSHLTDTLPAEMTFITATAPWDPNQRWYPDQITGTTSVRWSWGPSWSDSAWYFDVVAQIADTVQGGDELTNVVEYRDDNLNNQDRFPDDSVFELPLTILAPVFEVSKVYESNRVAGMPVTYTLTVINAGNYPGTNVVISDTIPAYLEDVSADGTLQFPWLWWLLGPIAPYGGTDTAEFYATLPCTVGLSIVNDDYGVRGSDQEVVSPPGDPVSLTVLTPTLSPTFTQSATVIDADTTVTFTDTSTTDGTDIVAWAWDFGDGGTGSGEVVSHTYGGTGGYTVTLTITDTCGISKSGAVPNAVVIAKTHVFLPLVLRNH